MANVFFCKQIYLDEYLKSVFYCRSDEQWLENIEKGDFVFYHLLGGEFGRNYVLKNIPSELTTFENLSKYVSKLMKFDGWEHDDENNEYAKFSTLCEFQIPCRKFQALNLFKFYVSLLNKSVKQTKGRSLFKLDPVDINKFSDIVNQGKFIDYINNEDNYRKFEKVVSAKQFDSNSQNIQFFVSNEKNKEVTINTAPSFYDGVRSIMDIKKLQYPLDSRNTYRNKFINFLFNGDVDSKKYYDLFTGFWDALCQKSFSSLKNQKKKSNTNIANDDADEDNIDEVIEYNNEILCKKLLASKNIILRGAPGTGKTFLAKSIAADIVSDGENYEFEKLSPELKQQIGFVQFHPNYDYTDFVEGLRPIVNKGEMSFELHDGVFKNFVEIARHNEESFRGSDMYKNEQSAKEALSNFLSNIEYDVTEFRTKTKNLFYISDADDAHIYINMPNNKNITSLVLNVNEIIMMLESDREFNAVTDVADFFGKNNPTQAHSYNYVIYRAIKHRNFQSQNTITESNKIFEYKKYVFIIDEINRGEISKILGELFFSIDPGCRGIKGAISTQYQNLHKNPNDKFYIPDNVYIIGTMNDIDRSVDTFDYAMRRRFRFIEVTPNERTCMIEEELPDVNLQNMAISCMKNLNKYICEKVDGLNSNYQIGPAYFIKLRVCSPEELWADSLKPLLLDYVQGMPNEGEHMKEFEKIFFHSFSDFLVNKFEELSNEIMHS